MPANPNKPVTVKIDNTSVMSSHESAYITVTSPTGKTIILKKHNLGLVSDELKKVFWKCCGDPMVAFQGERVITLAEMQLALEFSKFYYRK